MITSQSYLTGLRRRLRLTALTLPATCGLALLSGMSVQAKPIPDNLGNGLSKLAESSRAVAEATKSGVQLSGAVTVGGKVYTDEQTASYATLALTDSTSDRVMVRINPDGTLPLKQLRQSLKANVDSLSIINSVKDYQGVGVLEAYVSVDDAAKLGGQPGVRSVILELKPYTKKVNPEALANTKGGGKGGQPQATNGQVLNKLGTAFDQGVFQHRVDTINRGYNGLTTGPDWEGQGLKQACISNSYGSNPTNTPAIDVNNGDLPGTGNAYNTTPVYVLQDDVGDGTVDDEGRAMCQIAYKMAPKASLAFATADGGELGFANNIRLLGGLTVNGVTGTFGADVICDDVGYYDEPFFQDGIIAQGIDDVNAAGISYFSSAANDVGVNGYDSNTRWVANGTGLTAAAGNTALANTNIDLTNVPTNLYQGGFHNFNPAGLDVAQTVNVQTTANAVPTILQWTDPYDQNTTPVYTGTLLSTTGNSTTPHLTFTATGTVTQGVLYAVSEAATNGSLFDGIVTVYRSDGTTVIAGPQDTGGDEQVRFYAPVNDTGFVIKIGHFSTTTGTFSLIVRSSSGFASPIPSRLSILAFNVTTGAYVPASSLTGDTTATNEPIQVGVTPRITGSTQLQYVIARAAVPAAGANLPVHLRYQLPGNGISGLGPAEYFTYNSVTTGGHAAAAGCNGACAYPFSRPSIPEGFSSPGPVTIFYDKNSVPLNPPQVRLKPSLAATDLGNISTNMSYFSGDSGNDTDTNPNFSGTSAASPHLMSCGLLTLQSHGGRRSLTPAQLTNILQRSTFPHDLDPGFSSGAARVTGGTTGSGKVTITVNSDNTANGGTGSNDNNSIAISYVGGSAITSFVFNPTGTAATAGGTSNGNNGVQYSTTASGGTATYFTNDYPGMVFAVASKAFTVGSASTIATANVVATPSNLAPAPSTTQNYTLSLAFNGGTFTGGNVLRFNVGRSIQHSAATGNTAGTIGAGTTTNNYNGDLLGGTFLLPTGNTAAANIGTGMTFSGTTADGGAFVGTINNRIGSGYSVLDGYGFVNMEQAVVTPLQ